MPPGAEAAENQKSTPLAFTLLELLAVIAIIGLIAAIAVPTLSKFRPNYSASATRQLLDDLARARQLAISQRTTVFMVFVPTNFWNDPAFNQAWAALKPSRCTNLLAKQAIGYNFVSLRSIGDQPGRPTARYLGSWKTLPEGAFIDPLKFAPNNYFFWVYTNDANLNPVPGFRVAGFDETTSIPFPSEDAPVARPRAPYVTVPFIAFDYTGALVSGDPRFPEVIPLSRGVVSFAHGPDRRPTEAVPSFTEQPVGNATNGASFSLVYIDRLTGRARAVQAEVR